MNDALFPLGAFSHSYGLETYIQQGIVSDAAGAEVFLRAWLSENFLYGDLLCAQTAWECGAKRDLPALLELEALALASRGPRELREAARKIGSRFLKTMLILLPKAGLDAAFLIEFSARLAERGLSPSHAAGYGACCGALGIDRALSLESYCYAQTSALVTCCVKTIPLSQTAGQSLLTGLFGLMQDLIARAAHLSEQDLYRGSPGFDIRAMEHETLYSRLYMS
jgi:urease accessory protein